MSKSSIKTKTVLTMTDMTQSTELQAFIRQKDGYKVTVKISLCICKSKLEQQTFINYLRDSEPFNSKHYTLFYVVILLIKHPLGPSLQILVRAEDLVQQRWAVTIQVRITTDK